MNTELQAKLDEIFFPIGKKRMEEFKREGKSLAYYTTADTAKKIIANKELWMRNVSVMNDFSEVKFGVNRLSKVLYGAKGQELVQALCKFNGCNDEQTQQMWKLAIMKFFEQEQISWSNNTYITCFTEHTKEEHQDGRLSMWRAYGGANGVAIVFKSGMLFEPLAEQKIFLSPVAYFHSGDTDLEQSVQMVIDSIAQGAKTVNLQFKGVNEVKAAVNNTLNWALRFAITSIKHKGFKEEAEWRLLAHGQDLVDNDNLVIESLHGVEQPIFKIKYRPDELFSLIDRFIIGPNADFGIRNVAQKALVKLVSEQFGVATSEAEKKVMGSTIPYRPT